MKITDDMIFYCKMVEICEDAENGMRKFKQEYQAMLRKRIAEECRNDRGFNINDYDAFVKEIKQKANEAYKN